MQRRTSRSRWSSAGLTNSVARRAQLGWAWPLPPAEFHTRIFPWRMMHAPLVGPYLLGRHNALSGRGIYLSVVDREKFRKHAQQAYEWALPDPATRLLDATAGAFERFTWIENKLATCRLSSMTSGGARTMSSLIATDSPRSSVNSFLRKITI
jgi:hypothetical protein